MGKLKPDDTRRNLYRNKRGYFWKCFLNTTINQPQVGILALGAIRKVPAVIETQKEILSVFVKECSHSYDHRVVDGALGGNFVKRVAEYLEAFDVNRDL
jgi:2-oxoglutarate dehydrogenase E2 component (dihydrolipoamide succinyltransferase)